MLLRDLMEPVAQYAVSLLRENGVEMQGPWDTYKFGHLDNNLKVPRNKRDFADLIPMRQTKDDAVGYCWNKNGYAHVWIKNIRFLPVDPSKCDMSERIVLDSRLKASDNIPYKNPTSEVQETEIEHFSSEGANEVSAITAGFEKKVTVSAEVSGGVEGIAEAKASVVDETTIKAGYENTTGRNYQSGTRKTYRMRQPAFTSGEGRLTWNEQTCQTRVQGEQKIEFAIEIYWWHKYRKYNARKAKKETRYRKRSHVEFSSIYRLIELLEGRGSVHTPYFEHFLRRKVDKRYIETLKSLLVKDVDFLTEPYKESSEFKTEIANVVYLDRPDMEEED